jgi:flagellar basal-body rod modification protein FlgD
MTATDPIATYAAQTQAALAAANAKKTSNNLGIEDFLALMTAQLKNQDPMKPLEGTEFVAQLAQFGAVSGIQNMQGSIESLASSLRSTQVLNGTTMVGHDVLALADGFSFSQGVPVSGEIDVPAGARSLEVRITDASGQVVRTMSVTPNTGTNTFTWDGMRDDGTAASSGDYEIEAVANIDSASESLNVLLTGRVSSVTIDSTGTGLTLNTSSLGALSLADVRRVM